VQGQAKLCVAVVNVVGHQRYLLEAGRQRQRGKDVRVSRMNAVLIDSSVCFYRDDLRLSG
jgi:hypothetical protein